MTSETQGSPMLSMRQVAARLGVNVAKVRRLRAAGAFPHARQYGESSSCHWHIPTADVEAYLETTLKRSRVAPRPAHTRGQG